MPRLHDEVVARLRFFDGHSDTLGLLADGRFLRLAATELAVPFRDRDVTKVAGVEARGFAFAAAVAVAMGVGFVAIRKAGSVHPGPKVELRAPPDWRGIESVLRVQRHAIVSGDRVLLVDDWAETGSKALTARRLIEESEACMSACPCSSTSSRTTAVRLLLRSWPQLAPRRSRARAAARTGRSLRVRCDHGSPAASSLRTGP